MIVKSRSIITLLTCCLVILSGSGFLHTFKPDKSASVWQDKKFTCVDMPDHFANVETALDFIRNCRFEFEEAFEVLAVRGIRNVSYHSCDKETGHLVLVTHDRTYIHKEVPIKVWEAFKYAESIETYYRLNIKFTYIPV